MRLRIATFNRNTLSGRAKVPNLETDNSFSSSTKEVLSDIAQLNSPHEKDNYTHNTRTGSIIPHLKDALDWNGFSGEQGTYHTSKQQIDYLLVSKPLFDALTEVGIERRGIFKKNNNSFVGVISKATQASGHACMRATLDV